MDVESVKRRLADIKASAGDDEGAHVMEDTLHRDVLMAIRDHDCDDPAGCAGEAIKSGEIQFSRWCA